MAPGQVAGCDTGRALARSRPRTVSLAARRSSRTRGVGRVGLLHRVEQRRRRSSSASATWPLYLASLGQQRHRPVVALGGDRIEHLLRPAGLVLQPVEVVHALVHPPDDDEAQDRQGHEQQGTDEEAGEQLEVDARSYPGGDIDERAKPAGEARQPWLGERHPAYSLRTAPTDRPDRIGGALDEPPPGSTGRQRIRGSTIWAHLELESASSPSSGQATRPTPPSRGRAGRPSRYSPTRKISGSCRPSTKAAALLAGSDRRESVYWPSRLRNHARTRLVQPRRKTRSGLRQSGEPPARKGRSRDRPFVI